jgi:hypothetical protein
MSLVFEGGASSNFGASLLSCTPQRQRILTPFLLIVASICTLWVISSNRLSGAVECNPLARGEQLVSGAPPPLPSHYPRVLISYVHYESNNTNTNLEYFLKHALHSKPGVDFVFTINGNASVDIPDLPNVLVIERNNTCMDIGTHKEVLETHVDRRKYDKFILMNGSVRGPFMPPYGNQCWSDAFIGMVDDTYKLVGTTTSCANKTRRMNWKAHLPSMLLATDNVGLDLILPNLKCYTTKKEAIIEAELEMAWMVMAGGYKARSIQASFTDDYWRSACSRPGQGELPLERNGYYGGNIQPYEVIFIKTKTSRAQRRALENYTGWFQNFSSLDHCK